MDTKEKKLVLFSRKKRPGKTATAGARTEATTPASSRTEGTRPSGIRTETTRPSAAVLQASKPATKKKKKKKSLKRRLVTLGVILVFIVGLYCTAVFSNIPFVKKWRDIYIFTAMDTYTHKWLAEYFIPASVIDAVMKEKEEFTDSQLELESSWAPTPDNPSPSVKPSTGPEVVGEDGAKLSLLNRFSEIDKASFDDYIAKNPELITDGYDKLLINEASLDKKGTTIKTTAGDQVLVLDAENGILIVKVTGSGYVGKLAIIKNPVQVRVGISKYLGSIGQQIGTIAANNNAVLAINASGFADPEWNGNGGSVVGLLISGGKTYNKAIKGGYLAIGFAEDDRLHIGSYSSKIIYRDAVEFMPAIIINGKDVTGSATGFYGIQPRSAIGQAEDGTVFLLTIDGRQVGYSVGATVVDAAKILLRYDAVQAANLDGGSSTIMIYRDEIITKTSGLQDFGRLCPDAFIVDYASSLKQELDGPG
jgi:exopolysaccharide biosynthesis protein